MTASEFLPQVIYNSEGLHFKGLDKYDEAIDKMVDNANHFIVTEDTLKGAKAELADYRKKKKASSDYRSTVKKQLLAQFEDLNHHMLDSEKRLNDALSNIAQQVDDYEQEEKNKRQEAINDYLKEVCSKEFINWEDVQQSSSWTNKGNFLAGYKLSKRFIDDRIKPEIGRLELERDEFKKDSVMVRSVAKELSLDVEPYLDELKRLGLTDTLSNMKKDNDNRQARKEAEQAIKDFSANKTVDKATGEIKREYHYKMEFWSDDLEKMDMLRDFLDDNKIKWKKLEG